MKQETIKQQTEQSEHLFLISIQSLDLFDIVILNKTLLNRIRKDASRGTDSNEAKKKKKESSKRR